MSWGRLILTLAAVLPATFVAQELHCSAETVFETGAVSLLAKARHQSVKKVTTESQELATAHENDSKLVDQEAEGVLKDAQPVSDSTTETHSSWFERLGNAIFAVLLGLFVLIPFSIALLWVNERRNAQLQSLISVGQSEAETVEAKTQTDISDYDGTLVHLNSEVAKGLEPLADERFPSFKMKSGCLRLSSYVEVYQWVEEVSEKKEKDSVGGGETTRKTYAYKQKWTDRIVNSGSFHQRHGHSNSVHVNDLAPGLRMKTNNTVKYGDAYFLPKALTEQIGQYEDASKVVGGDLSFMSCTFRKSGDYFYCPAKKQGSPNIGDFRVKLQYIPDTPASILALQIKDKTHEGGHTFAPYRMVPRGLCGGMRESDLKKRRIDQSKKDGDDLYEEEKCWDFGPFACLCCCCNLVTYCFTHLSTSSAGLSLTPEIYSAWTGKLSIKECFASVQNESVVKKWFIRLLGWALLWIGFNSLFDPLEVVLDIFPFIGPYAGTAFSAVMGFFTFLLTVALATFIVSLAYLIYHPLIGFVYLAVSGGIVYGIVFVAQLLDAKNKHA
eukprot:TRINITY_DN2785_c0_g1_i5.p1 TRINITY_DN2785_c0_g1~~TRINITY_DN2785_c0_g1_i5.p1  ORF type:complete len:555 (-),score=109.08 TRINITY_DN2785_c0_g1_i5:44-1708(-)